MCGTAPAMISPPMQPVIVKPCTCDGQARGWPRYRCKIPFMEEGATFCAQRINFGQSEIWLQLEGRELTPRRTLATNEVVNVVRRCCEPEVFKKFYADCHTALAHVGMLTIANGNELLTELKLTT
jgi:hypothetical protein